MLLKEEVTQYMMENLVSVQWDVRTGKLTGYVTTDRGVVEISLPHTPCQLQEDIREWKNSVKVKREQDEKETLQNKEAYIDHLLNERPYTGK